jgi:hypothetical protein
MSRLTAADRVTIRSALHRAIDWEDGLIDAYAHIPDDPAIADAKAAKRNYQRLLKKMFGTSASAADVAVQGATYVSLDELRAMNVKGGGDA